MNRAFASLLCAMLMWASPCPGDVAPGQFSPLPLPYPASTIALSEDGRFLFVAHEAQDQVTVWDIAGGAAVRTLACPSPRAMICRDGKLFVGSFGHGKISAFKTADGSILDELLVGGENVVYLSAPAGHAFQNQLFATTKSENGTHSFLVDTSKDDHRELGNIFGCLTASLDGKYLVNPQLRTYLMSSIISHGMEAKDLGAAYTGRPMIYQVHPGPFWFTDNAIYTIDPPSQVEAEMGRLIVPDSNADTFYELTDDKILAFRPNLTLDSLGEAAVSYDHIDPALTAASEPSKPKKKKHRAATDQSPKPDRDVDLRQVFNFHRRWDAGLLDTPVAVTLNKTLYVFVVDARHSTLLGATFPAFSQTAGPAQAGGPSSLAATEASFPDTIPAGKAFSFKLPVDPTAKLTLVNPPTGLSLAGGALSWTPALADAGEHPIKIRVDDEGQTSFLRYSLTVMSPAGSLAVVPGSPAKVSTAALPLEGDDYDLGYSYDRNSILILSGDKLRGTNPAGRAPAFAHKLPRRYTRLIERDVYDVAISNNTLDLLDKKTFDVIRSISLGTPLTFDLALHPTRRVAYVAVSDDDGGRTAPLLSRQIYEVNETSGSIRKIPRAHGQWVVADPLGRAIYVGLRDLYQNGITLDLDIGEILPTYGHIDMLEPFYLSDSSIRAGLVNIKSGTNGRCLRIAPDGKVVCYVSAAGSPVYSNSVPGFDPSDVTRTLVSYSMKGLGFPSDIAFHNSLPLVAVITDQNVCIFDRATGDKIDDKLDLSPMPLRNLRRCLFSPDGLSLVIDDDTAAGRQLVAYPLKLSDAEKSELSKKPAAPPKSEPVRDAPPDNAERADASPIGREPF